MTWHVQLRDDTRDVVERYATPEAAIEAACRHIDAERDVYGIGTGPLTLSISRAEIARIYALWARATRPYPEGRSASEAVLGRYAARGQSGG